MSRIAVGWRRKASPCEDRSVIGDLVPPSPTGGFGPSCEQPPRDPILAGGTEHVRCRATETHVLEDCELCLSARRHSESFPDQNLIGRESDALTHDRPVPAPSEDRVVKIAI